ncbi:DUF932 domain-containing protein [Ideonella sp. DXS29W]|uniref:DUF932 domain-containing protein n=1 Tax=Ideonella lacteola TaxID=2984193 RepID=A0ABU9BWV5_9BURK
MRHSLATTFKNRPKGLRSETPLSDDQIRAVAPSIFADGAHSSRSERYAYIPTSSVLQGLRNEGFAPFMVVQARTLDDGKREHTKHMIRLRHASQINTTEANEIILINSHDGTTSYQMFAGMLRFVCCNGLVCGENISDIRIPHKGNVVDRVIGGAFEVLDGFTRVVEEREAMGAAQLSPDEQTIFAEAALSLKYDPESLTPPPITPAQLLRPRRVADVGPDAWTTMNRVQENMIQGGLVGRSATGQRTRTRAVTSIDTNIKLNRALWMLADKMAKLKG